MYSILQDLGDDVIGVRVSGTLTASDYERLAPWAKVEAARPGKRRVLVDTRGFTGWDSLEAGIADLRLDAAVHRQLDRVAIVGDRRWHELMTRLSDPFTPADVRYFDAEAFDDALRWVRA